MSTTKTKILRYQSNKICTRSIRVSELQKIMENSHRDSVNCLSSYSNLLRKLGRQPGSGPTPCCLAGEVYWCLAQRYQEFACMTALYCV